MTVWLLQSSSLTPDAKGRPAGSKTVKAPSLCQTSGLFAALRGHSCMLLHRSDGGNLLHPSWPRGAELTRWQRAVLRASRPVTFF